MQNHVACILTKDLQIQQNHANPAGLQCLSVYTVTELDCSAYEWHIARTRQFINTLSRLLLLLLLLFADHCIEYKLLIFDSQCCSPALIYLPKLLLVSYVLAIGTPAQLTSLLVFLPKTGYLHTGRIGVSPKQCYVCLTLVRRFYYTLGLTYCMEVVNIAHVLHIFK